MSHGRIVGAGSRVARELSEAHKASLAAGRKKRADRMREEGAKRAVQFNAWSKEHARVWAEWQINCGRSQHDCTWCNDFRRTTAAIPELGRDEDFDYARSQGLI